MDHKKLVKIVYTDFINAFDNAGLTDYLSRLILLALISADVAWVLFLQNLMYCQMHLSFRSVAF